MPKFLFSKETYGFQFKEEDRKKILDWVTECTGITNITDFTIYPYGLYVETLVTEEETANGQ